MIPVDEMLTDLRGKLEAFDAAPSDETLSAVWKEVGRIVDCCEAALEDEGQQQ